MVERIGQQVGNYRLVKRLGEGGFAEVYLGEHHILKNYAALKFLKVALSSKETRQFVFEGQTLVRLRHRHIVHALDFSMDRGHPVLITDYISGGSLRDRHERKAILPLDLVINYVKQISMALQYAHNQHVIHRDIKPENILIDADQQLCLSDFGLAIFAPSSSELSLNVEGTLLYMAPEQVQGRPTFASDQYSLGIMVYEWLCGNRPFSGNRFELMSAHLYAEPQPLREVCPELPEEVEKVVLRALAKDPQQRYVSVQAFAQALERASEEQIQGNAITDMLQKKPFKPSLAISSEMPLQRKLFIAAAPEDGAFVEQLSKDLRQHNVDFSHDLRAPLKQEEPLREAIRAAYLVCLIASPHMRGSQEVQNYLRIALLYKRRLVLVWASGESVASSLLDLSGRTRPPDVIDARKERYATALEEIIDCLREDTGITPIVATLLTALTEEPRNPYKGLRAFTRDDASDFFGRDALIQRTLGVLDNMLDVRWSLQRSQRLLSVVGPSGSGKSSLVMAGLLPKLQRGALPGSENWCYLDPLLPGQHPCEALLALLAQQFPKKNSADVRNVLVAEQGYGLHQLATYLSRPNNRRVVLCIDQFEEIFALGVSEPERQHFLRLLINAVTDPQSPVIVILTLRADFYDRPMHYRELARLIEANQVSVLPMDNQELRTAIENPAYQGDVQLLFEGDLVGDLLFELQGQNNALPLLEFTLEQLFQQRQDLMLTQEAYKAIGGLRGALARHAEDVYIHLVSDQERVLARTLFLRLIDPGKSELDTTRRRAALSELLLENDEETLVLSNVAHTFIDARLLTTNAIAGITSIEVSHEALIREWPRLATWLHEAREDIILQHNIATDVANWLKHDKAEDRLYRGVQLQEAVLWAKRQIANANEVAFIQTSHAEQGRREKENQLRLQRELILKRQTVQRLRAFLIAVSVLLIVSVVFAGSFVQLNGKLHKSLTQDEQDLKVSQALTLSANAYANATTGKIDTALLLANAATQKNDALETRNMLLQTLELNPQLRGIQPVLSTKIRMILLDTRYHAVIYSDGFHIYIDDANTGKQELSFNPGSQLLVGAIALSPDETTLAIANNEGVWLWNMQTMSVIRRLDTALDASLVTLGTHAALSFSKDGKALLSSRCIRYADLETANERCLEIVASSWNIQTGQPFSSPQTIASTMYSDTFVVSSDGHYLATSNNETTKIWNLMTGQSLDLVSASNVNQLAFSPDGGVIAIATENNAVQLWKSGTGLPVAKAVLTGHSFKITSLAFSPNGQMLAATSLDQTLLLWNTQTYEKLLTLNGDNQQKFGVAFSRDGQMLCTTSYSVSYGGKLLVWDDTLDSSISHVLPSNTLMHSPLFSPDGKWIYIGRLDGQIERRSSQFDNAPAFMNTTNYIGLPLNKSASPLSVHSMALSRDGHILVAGRIDSLITIWDVHRQPFKLLGHFTYPEPVVHLQLSDDGKILVSNDPSGTIIVWDISNPTNPIMLKLPTQDKGKQIDPQNVAFSPDGKLVALWFCVAKPCLKEQITLWNIKQKTFSQNTSPILSQGGFLAFSPDNHTVAAITSGNVLHLWDSSKQKSPMISQTLPAIDQVTGQSENYAALCFSSDGKKLVMYTESYPFSFVVWNVNSQGLELFANPISIRQGFEGDMSFSPNGAQLISAIHLSTEQNINYGKLLLWDINVSSWREHTCNIVRRTLSKQTWSIYAGNQSYIDACPKYSIGPPKT